MDVIDVYKKYFGIDNPYPHQVDLFKKLSSGVFPIILKAPTGSGKTEAVLAPFLHQFLKNDFVIAPRMIYVLPMRVLVNSTAERIKNYAKRVSPDVSVDVQHGEIPGAPFFMSDIVVTTLDQFVYAFARASSQVGRHLDMPAGAIASSIVVFDEAHMYRDEYTFAVMRAIMEILYKANIPFVVMTATMPESLKESLFENIPLSDERVITGNTSVKSSVEIKLVDDKLVKDDKINLPDDLLKKIKERKTLIVLNQVERAQRVYEALKNKLSLESDEIVLLHSRFTHSDRKRHEEKALSLIPHKKAGEKVIPEGAGIVVATQVLEAGIDFSAELLITELAPADSLVQRAGRCARYDGEEGEMVIYTGYIDESESIPVRKAKKGKEKTEEESKKDYLPYKNEDLKSTLKWLKENPEFDIKDFEEVEKFVNVLDYKASDFEASDTLVDLYECVLYADSAPENIQVRQGKPVTLIVADIPKAKGKKKKSEEQTINVDAENSLSVDINLAYKLFEEKRIVGELKWKFDGKKFEPDPNFFEKETVERAIVPFKTYILPKQHYSEEKGILT